MSVAMDDLGGIVIIFVAVLMLAYSGLIVFVLVRHLIAALRGRDKLDHFLWTKRLSCIHSILFLPNIFEIIVEKESAPPTFELLFWLILDASTGLLADLFRMLPVRLWFRRTALMLGVLSVLASLIFILIVNLWDIGPSSIQPAISNITDEQSDVTYRMLSDLPILTALLPATTFIFVFGAFLGALIGVVIYLATWGRRKVFAKFGHIDN